MPSDCGSAWSPPASNSERRLSNSSDGSAGSGYSKAVSSKFILIELFLLTCRVTQSPFENLCNVISEVLTRSERYKTRWQILENFYSFKSVCRLLLKTATVNGVGRY